VDHLAGSTPHPPITQKALITLACFISLPIMPPHDAPPAEAEAEYYAHHEAGQHTGHT
jgi:hypothetical protein